ncbi:MAG: alcohol dehydrogenase catalytic domain-containing protein [Chloroflexi bacterium]|nr:alcohol dehydrogenase catalytic domain-containing protein [Chloroflexota bacterium]
MKAIQFNAAIPRYALGLALGKIYQPILWSGLSCTQYVDAPEPRLPNDEWVKIKTRYGGICGSDNHLLHLHNSPAASAVTSFPFVIGHENVGTILELGSRVRDVAMGERVVIEPTLWCKPRGFADLCECCARGDIQLCERITEGTISAGLILGSCRDTGGSWSPYYLAHASQVYRVPDAVSDENALLVEPFATSLHAVLANLPSDNETVLVFGAGVIGLGIIAALRALESKARIIVLARHGIQQELAKKFGADMVISASRNANHFAEFARAVNGKLLKPILGKPVLIGGAEVVYECVGNADSIDDALRFTRASGVVVLAGLAAVPNGVDWTPIWMKELHLKGTYTYGHDDFRGERWKTFDLALDLMARGKVDLSPMITHKFPLNEYARAFDVVNKRSRERSVKVVFEFD